MFSTHGWSQFLFCFFVGTLALQSASSWAYGRAAHVLIDPGHGGQDLGAQVGRLKEAEVVWPWALALRKELLRFGYQVTLTRGENESPPHQERLSLIKKPEFDLIVSLHANFLQDPRVRGTEFYIQNPLSLEDQNLFLAHEEVQNKSQFKSDRESHLFTILSDLKKQAQIKSSFLLAQKIQKKWNGKIKQGPFEVLSESRSPSILIELGFLSSPLDQKNLADPKFMNHHVALLVEALNEDFRSQKSKDLISY